MYNLYSMCKITLHFNAHVLEIFKTLVTIERRASESIPLMLVWEGNILTGRLQAKGSSRGIRPCQCPHSPAREAHDGLRAPSW